jgi:hypothetical protein
MKKGKKPGKMNPGGMGKGMSKEIAKMAAQQEMIRKEIRKMSEELSKQGDLGGSGELKKLEKMLEKNEEDLINLKLDQEFFQRQKDIEVKLLEAENSERKREKENRRESKAGKDYQKNALNSMEDYENRKKYELELLRLLNPQLNSYYKNKVGEYNEIEK